MNYLAHLYLADDDPEFLIGSLMGDFLKGQVDEDLPVARRQGILLHRKIDVYTDAHPVFRSSRRRLRPEYRRYGGILIDVFYDHFLARNWEVYSSVSLCRFSRRVYRILLSQYETLPSAMQRSVRYMIGNDLLLSYEHLSGISRALHGIEGRLRRESRLGEAVADLRLNYDSLGSDFADFFPDLLAYVQMMSNSDTSL